MTPRELNNAVKILNSELYRMSFGDLDEYIKYRDNEAKKEFIRLYHADETMESLTKRSILIMFRLNLKHRFIAFHLFGINIKLFDN